MSTEAAINEFVRASFPAGDVLSITVSAPYESYGALGMMLIDVMVTIKGTPREVALKEPPGFVSGIRKRLAEIGEEAFPLVGFRPDPLPLAGCTNDLLGAGRV